LPSPIAVIPRDHGDHQIACVAPALLPVGLGFDPGEHGDMSATPPRYALTRIPKGLTEVIPEYPRLA